MRKIERVFREQLREAIRAVQQECDQSESFDRGMYAGASAVAVKLAAIQRRDEQMKAEGIKRGSP